MRSMPMVSQGKLVLKQNNESKLLYGFNEGRLVDA
ncbi:unnamed protein product [Fusarium graminearum]|nr:unnamed protein product [Fusarium graminearum]CAG1989933.1 unnamed protein product [Fusarium graminearum]VTO87910.1 unnamed protein product [Fusarium graminearum]